MKKEQETIFLSALEQNQEKLFRICSIYSEENEDAKDLFQEVLAHVWRSMSTFKGNSSIGTKAIKASISVSILPFQQSLLCSSSSYETRH